MIPGAPGGASPTAPGWAERLGAVLSRDYGQRFDRFLRRLRNPLVVLILAAGVATLCGFSLHPQGFVLAIGLGVAIGVGVVWPWSTVLGLRGVVGFDRARVREGEPVRVSLSLRNRAPWSAWGLEVRSGFGAAADAGLTRVGGWRRADLAWDFVPERRGVYPAEAARITTGFPFGLVTASRSLTATNELVVWPRTVPVGPIPATALGQTAAGTAVRNRAGDSGDFLGVRPYRRGDSLRRVHWPQTARSGQMVICEQQSHATPRVQVVLDTHPLAHGGAGATSSLEWAIRVAASFVVAWSTAGAEVELVLAAGPVAVPPGSLARRRAGWLDALARIQADPAAPPLADWLDGITGRTVAGGLRIVVATDRAVGALGHRPPGGTERFVVLQADAFDPAGSLVRPAPLAVAPWIWLDDPERVSEQIRWAGKETSLAR